MDFNLIEFRNYYKTQIKFMVKSSRNQNIPKSLGEGARYSGWAAPGHERNKGKSALTSAGN